LYAVLAGGGAWVLWWQSNRLDAGAVATLVGALFGGSAVLLGNGISALDERARASDELQVRQKKLKTFITGELVGVAVDLLSGKQSLDAAVEQVRSVAGARLPSIEVGQNFPRDLSLTMNLVPSCSRWSQKTWSRLLTCTSISPPRELM
jgi:hypothetical protein